MLRWFACAGGILCGLGVAAGSFGAHGLRPLLEATGRADNWETAVRYGLYHGLAVLVTGVVAALPRTRRAAGLLRGAGWSFVLGTLVFSGCLAALALTGVRILGAIVPIGGVLLLLGWALMVAAAFRFDAD